MTKNGAQMAFVSLEDRFGELEVIVFPKTFEAVSHLLTNEAAVCVVGQLSLRDDEDPKVLAQNVFRLDDNAHFSESSMLPGTRHPGVKPQRENVRQSVPETPVKAGTDTHGGMKFYHVSGVTAPPPAAVPMCAPNPVRSVQAEPAKAYSPAPQQIGKVYLRVEHTDERDRLFKKAENLVYIFCDGLAEVIFYDKSTSEYKRLSGIKLAASPFVINELKALLGDDNVVIK